MKKIYTIVLTALSVCSTQIIKAQCTGIKGPNLLGAKGTFSAPFITVNNAASICITGGSNTFNPVGNVGNAIAGCANSGTALPCSDYLYTDTAKGLVPASTYSILKNIGDVNGGNCIKGDWRGRDHTGDGGYFMAVNGAPANTFSPLFYQVKNIAVCIGATYEFSAWVINLLPGSSGNAKAGSEPNISFKVNGNVIGNSGPIAYNNTATWVKVAGSFVASTNSVDLEVVNATSVAIGNDLGLDDISINVCESQISINAPATSVCDGTDVSLSFTVSDNFQTNSWYKWQISTDGGISFTNTTSGAQATFTGSSYTLPLNIGIVTPGMNGYKYRLAVSTSQQGLENPDCIYFNDYTLIVTSCGPLPVQLISFNGRYIAGKSLLEWQTAREYNSDHFELFRSNDGNDFIKIASIKTSGNSNTIKTYNYQDNITGSTGSYQYYRLKQVDINGKATFSSIIKLDLGSKPSGFEVFPNPFINNFTVSFNAGKTAIATLKIQNSAGHLIYTKRLTVTKGNNSIVINNLPVMGSGIYYIAIVNDEFSLKGKLQKL